ncbi:methyl-accepting chemotaxis protein [Oceanospirillum linum]|uniref:Methyl-accepting chemotaxis protein n=1 Tax=Oceanospirillum linum TaxID=966 RepID=A0A1T1HG06_OCELI|nr:methyl-accepting chemotaxis protein [Oceanospirillum linum]OOV88746.1 hypothetical protein BTA35_0204510 [Oceanospirillum linum]SEG01017.1 methyl-accepting chemotaxis sensory transducer with Cache sensor [Oleiphilus messinensis]SMP21913.1 methyl-accepting chemotaxis sensory transducer with Cache sensor [Oceanospirillum linum]
MRYSIKNQLILGLGLLLILVLGAQLLVGLYYSDRSRQLLADEAGKLLSHEAMIRLKQRATLEAGQIQQLLDRAYQVTHGLAVTAGQLKSEVAWEDPALQLERGQFIGVLRGSLLAHKEFLTLYTAWEANAFDDGDDDNLLNRLTGSTEDGRFAPLLSRSESGHIEMTPLRAHESQERFADGTRKAEFYLCPKEQRTACLLEPQRFQVQGQDRLLTSVVVPVMHKERFLGMVGADLSLGFIQQQAQSISQSLYQGQAQVRILSRKGIVLGDSHRPYDVGSPLKGASGSDRKDADFLTADVPIRLQGVTRSGWMLQIQVPKAIVLEPLVHLQARFAEVQKESSLMQLVLGPVLALLTLLLAAWLIHCRLAPLNQVQAMLKEVAQGGGDLTRRLNVSREDEVGRVAGYFNQFVGQLQALVDSVQRSGKQVQGSAQQGAALSEQMNTQLVSQQQQVSQISASVEQLSQSSHLIADSMEQLTQDAGQANAQVSQAQEVMYNVGHELASMHSEIHQACTESAQLSEHGNQIHQILETIRAIAEQTNLLALNAAIEAARAGEQGRGFAVVADEVRMLAQKTQTATGEIDGVIERLLGSIELIVTSSQRSGHRSESVLRQSQQTQEILNKVVTGIVQIDRRCQQVFLAVDEQQQAADHLVEAVNHVNEMAAQLLDGANSNREESCQLRALASDLNEKTCRFVV